MRNPLWRKNPVTTNYQMYNDSPPDYYHTEKGRWWDARRWGWKKITFLVVGIVVILVIVIAVAVTEVKKNAYPNYSKLNYTLLDDYSGTTFFDQFDYWNTYDPSSGFVHYLNAEQSAQYNLTYATADTQVIKVESTMTQQTTGRYSIRITSKKTYNSGLFIFDIQHTPYGCATWPALWLTDPNNWPTNGEIDVLEAVNPNSTSANQMTLHTTNSCSMSVKRLESGSPLTTDCYNATNYNSGCGVSAPSPSQLPTFGPLYNALGGGIAALELRAAGIRIWQFPRAAIPSDIAAGSPDPSSWSTALADFPSTDCDIASHFGNLSIIADIDLCGAWAGEASVYAGSGCSGSCTDFVAQNPAAFETAYWQFGGWKVYAAS